MHQNRQVQRQGFGWAIYPIMLAIAVLSSWTLEHDNLEAATSAKRLELQHVASTLAVQFQREVVAHEFIALAVADTVELHPEISQAELSRAVSALMEGHPSIMNVALAPDLVVTNMFPVEGNEAALGLDYRQHPEQLASVNRAIETRSLVLSGPVDLVQGGAAFIERAPVFLPGEGGSDERLWGIVSVAIGRDAFLEEVGLGALDSDVRVAVRNVDQFGPTDKVLWGDASVFLHDPVLQGIQFRTGSWDVGFVPREGWPTVAPDRWFIRGLVAVGAVLAGIMVFWLLRFARQREEAQRQLETAISSIEDGFALFDRDDRLVLCNAVYRSYYRVSGDLIVPGAKFEEIVRGGVALGQYPQAIGREEDFVAERMRQHRNPGAAVEQKLPDGRWLKIAEAKTPDGGTVGFRVDITELKTAKLKAEAGSRAKTEFMNVVSHELRTPLAAIIGFVKFLKTPQKLPSYKSLVELQDDGEASPDARRQMLDEFTKVVATYAGRIDVAGTHLLEMINEILDWSRLEARSVGLDCAMIPVDALIADVVAKFADAAAAKGLELTGAGNGLRLAGDRTRLTQVLEHLVENAIKFTEFGRVDVWAEMRAGKVAILVHDTGCGIEESALDLLFQQFRQLDSSATRQNSGTGLGLAIAQELVRLHGGSISVDSTAGKGSTFIILLPAMEAAARAA